MADLRAGGCLCGHARFEINITDSKTGTCHCRDCQKHSSAPFAIFTTVDHGAFRWLVKPQGIAKSSERAIRRFCEKCGSPLSWEGLEFPDEISVNTATFDDVSNIMPVYELYVRTRMAGIEPIKGARQYEAGGAY
ncbi:GFA family protein [Kordiimonas pumila]|uniref:GFA family protein n=1 Tax=Kordiimonas pumila TaxID=2161677 RepID=A0ABV7D1E7_9PROT|nr:GFA family protein [Kordiimonas pumila]